MRILQLITARQFRGAEIFANQLSRDLIRLGHEVLIVSLYSVETEKLEPAVNYHDLNGKKSRLLSFSLLRSLYKKYRKFAPDIIQSNAGDTLKYAVALRMFPGVKCPIVFRNASTISQYTGSGIKKQITGALLRKVAGVISVSNLSAADITALFPFLKNNTVVIPGGVDLNISIGPEREEYAALFEAGPVFIHVGGFSFEKNHEGLVRIMEKYMKEGLKGKLLLVGDGPLRKKIEQLVSDKKLNDQIMFLGSRKDVPDLLFRSDALLLPSVIEGLPTVILEAFQCKLPVIAYRVGGIPELVKKETGWLIEKGDEVNFVKAMMGVEKLSPDIKATFTNAAYLLLEREYDSRVISERFLKQYQSIVNKFNKRG